MPGEPRFYPLTASQKLLYVSQKYSKRKSIIDICTMMHFETEIDVSLMLQSISLALHRNRSASIRVRKVGKEIKQYFSEQPHQPVIVMDYTGRTDAELDADITRWSTTSFPNHSRDVQLFSCRLIKKPDGFYAVYFCVSHLAFDAYSLIMMANEILNIYLKMSSGLPIPLSKSNPLPCYEKEWEYLKSDAYKKDFDFWNNTVYSTEPKYTSVNGLSDKSHIKGKRYGKSVDIFRVEGKHENFTLPAELVLKVNDLARELSLSPQCIYLLAIRSFLSKENGNEEDVTIANNIARRATLVEKRAGGTRVQAINFRINLSNSLTVREALIEIYSIQRQYFAHANMPLYEIMDLYHKKFGVPSAHGYNSVWLTYQPYFVTFHEKLPVHFTVYSNGGCNMAIYLNIMALDNSGALNFNFDFPVKVTRPEVPRAMFEHITKVLEAATKNPDISLSELNQL